MNKIKSRNSEIFSNRYITSEVWLNWHIYQVCSDLFGPKYTTDYLKNAEKATNDRYGELRNGLGIENLITIHGSVDPWRKDVDSEIAEVANAANKPMLMIPDSHANSPMIIIGGRMIYSTRYE